MGTICAYAAAKHAAPSRLGSTFAALLVRADWMPCLGQPLRLAQLAHHLARLAVAEVHDDGATATGLASSHELQSRTQVLHARLMFCTLSSETIEKTRHHRTSGQSIKPADYPGLPLLDRNEKPRSRTSPTCASGRPADL